MRFIALLLPLIASGAMGCTTHRFLDRNSVRQTRTLSEIVQRQVLDNIALFSNNPVALPHFAIIGNGTAQVSDFVGVTPGLSWNSRTFAGATLGSNANRSLTENWKLSPVMTAGRLARLRCAFQFAFSSPEICLVAVETRNLHDPIREGQRRGPPSEFVPPLAGPTSYQGPAPLPRSEKYDVQVNEGCIQCVHELVSVGLLPKPACGTNCYISNCKS